jgi:hypothetical protein
MLMCRATSEWMALRSGRFYDSGLRLVRDWFRLVLKVLTLSLLALSYLKCSMLPLFRGVSVGSLQI